jgi:hypothetical protein
MLLLFDNPGEIACNRSIGTIKGWKVIELGPMIGGASWDDI